MPDTEHPIDAYLSHLARRLHLSPVERDQVLAEVRGHLEERAAALQESELSEEHAERQAVLAFGPVSRISRELRASHPIVWGKRRWLVGMLIGAVVTYAIYLVDTIPVLIYFFSAHHVSLLPLTSERLWFWADGGMLAYFGFQTFSSRVLEVLWMLVPFLVLYPVVPFLWGRRAQHWWVAGLAYGLGTGLLVVLQVVQINPQAINATSVLVVFDAVPLTVSLTLALAASFLGWWWRERSAAALSRAQAA